MSKPAPDEVPVVTLETLPYSILAASHPERYGYSSFTDPETGDVEIEIRLMPRIRPGRVKMAITTPS